MFSFSVLDRFNFSKIARLEMHIRLGNHQCVTKMQRPNYREVLSEMIQYVEHRLRQVNAGWMYIFQEKNEKENENFVNPFLHCIALHCLTDWLCTVCDGNSKVLLFTALQIRISIRWSRRAVRMIMATILLTKSISGIFFPNSYQKYFK